MMKTNVAFIGVGDISGIYLKNLSEKFNEELHIIGLYDLDRKKAEKAAEQYNVPKIYQSITELLADDEVDIVLNLTRPNEHYSITKAALEAGKPVYSEKPLAATISEGRSLLELAQEKQLAVGGAPDTFLGAGIQTCQKAIQDGLIGTPVGFTASMICRGHETWHPSPAFYYQAGGGPMMDMGPYYITALVKLLGKVQNVSAVTKSSFPERLITSEPLNGTKVAVEVPTFITGIMEMENGVTGTLFTTFDCYEDKQASITIYGSNGTLRVPDPNKFGGPVYYLAAGSKEYVELPLAYEYADNSRGIGILDMAKGIKENKNFQTDISLTYHVLEVMEAFHQSGEQRTHIPIQSEVIFA